MVLQLLRRWLWRRRRAIFRYWDGATHRFADPMAVYRALVQSPRFNWEVHPALVDLGDLDALAITAEAVRDAFNLPAVSHGGPTEAECVQLLGEFVAYLNALKKNGSPSPTLPEPTEPPSSTGATTVTSGPSDSGSTYIASKPAAPSAC